MKKIAEKVVLVAQICITVIFVLTIILTMSGVIKQADIQDNKVVIILFVVLSVVYACLCAYLLFNAFSEKMNIKRVLLFYDVDTATRASSKVITNIANGCASEVNELKVRKIKLSVDDKQGLIATIHVKASVDNIAPSIEKFRKLLIENFKATLGLTFSAINFEIDKLDKKYVPNTDIVTSVTEVDEQVTTTQTNGEAVEHAATEIEEIPEMVAVELGEDDEIVPELIDVE